ncbi:efflux RND transporter periplasmic adaptor subunit, partial [Nostoc linckia]|uniref:efflux RND transporter periplasmic adaptor subunit n=1 Tax=Nostoc linckia TaxID=92942 RepID=UPI00117FE024
MKRIYLLMIAAVLFSSCQQRSQSEAAAGEKIKLSLTDLDQQVEIFAEYDPFVKDSISKFAIHLTTLADYKPVKTAKVSTSLVVGDKGVRKVLDSATVPGIYKISLTPKSTGSGTLSFDIVLNGISHRFKIPAKVFDSYEEFAAQHKPATSSASEITFLKEQSWKLDFGVARIGKDNFSGVIKAPGTIIPATGDQQSVVATAAGVIKFQRALTSGIAVGKGQSLFSISGTSITGDNLNTAIQEAKLALAKAKSEYERAKALRPDQIISERDYQAALNSYQQQQLNYSKLTRNFSGNGVTIRSTGTGYLTELLVKEGDYVQAGQQLAIVAASKNIQLSVDVAASYAGQLGSVQSANFRIGEKVYELSSLGGKLVSYGRSVSPSGL